MRYIVTVPISVEAPDADEARTRVSILHSDYCDPTPNAWHLEILGEEIAVKEARQ